MKCIIKKTLRWTEIVRNSMEKCKLKLGNETQKYVDSRNEQMEGMDRQSGQKNQIVEMYRYNRQKEWSERMDIENNKKKKWLDRGMER